MNSQTGIGIPYTFFLYLYPVKIIAVGGLLILFRGSYTELTWTDLRCFSKTAISILTGIAVFVLWINLTWPWATIGTLNGFDPSLVSENFTRYLLIISRILGASIVVPIMEEIFWRSWLLRYLVSADFQSVELGRFSFSSFAIGSVLFGMEHNLWFAGIVAGASYSLLLYYSKSLAQCVLAHAVTNFILGLYVIQSSRWEFW